MDEEKKHEVLSGWKSFGWEYLVGTLVANNQKITMYLGVEDPMIETALSLSIENDEAFNLCMQHIKERKGSILAELNAIADLDDSDTAKVRTA
jgi:hypothetical protein